MSGSRRLEHHPHPAPSLRVIGLAACLIGLNAAAASAQGVEVVGTRALGMGGAFVAVADDATAVYWNPAGLPRSGLVNLSLERQQFETGPQDGPDPLRRPGDLEDGSATLVALGLPPVGLTYYRLRTTRLFAPGTNSPPPGAPLPSSLVTHNVGGSLVQSIGAHLDVATTIRFVRGVASVAPAGAGGSFTGRDGLDRTADLDGRGSQTVDLDFGALLVVGQVRAGLLVRNLREPEFETPEPGVSLSLDRQARAGVAWQSRSALTTVAMDIDLTESDSARGPQRHVAVGGEQWWASKRIGVRAGLRVNTADDAQPVGSAGASVRVSSSIFVDGQITRGAADDDRSWGVAVRFAY